MKKWHNKFGARILKSNPVKRNMDKLHKPSTHKDKTKYDRKSESEKMQDDLEPIHGQVIHDWEDEGGAVHQDYVHPTEHDESDDLEDAKRVKQPEKLWKPFNGGKGG